MAPDELFKGEVEEVIGKVQKSAEVLNMFRNTYNDHKEKMASYFKDGAEPCEWEFSSDLVFSRYEKFTERVQTVKVNIISRPIGIMTEPHVTLHLKACRGGKEEDQ